jgi:hypothetical protein
VTLSAKLQNKSEKWAQDDEKRGGKSWWYEKKVVFLQPRGQGRLTSDFLVEILVPPLPLFFMLR